MTTTQTPREAAKKALQEWYENETPENLTRFVDTLEPLLEDEVRTLRAEVVQELVGHQGQGRGYTLKLAAIQTVRDAAT